METSIKKTLGAILFASGALGVNKLLNEENSIIEKYLAKQEIISFQTVREARRFAFLNESDPYYAVPTIGYSVMMATGAILFFNERKSRTLH